MFYSGGNRINLKEEKSYTKNVFKAYAVFGVCTYNTTFYKSRFINQLFINNILKIKTMKNLLLIILILFSINTFSQEKKDNPMHNEVNMETNSGKFYQGVFTGAFVNLTVNEFTEDERKKWLKHPISLVTSILLELVFNKNSNLQKQAFVGLGAVTVNVTFEIFKSKRR